MSRVIGHIDLDYFYAQVEEVENPAISGRPVVVCVFSGRTENSGVVSTANYVARELGIKSGIPIALAAKRLEGRSPVVVKMNREKYEFVSERVMEIVRARVDVMEQTGIDEAFFDLSRSSRGDFLVAASTAKEVKAAILAEEHLACSVGLGRSKAVAKLCSDMAKPGGLVVVDEEHTSDFLQSLDTSKLYGVGPKTASTLNAMGIMTLGGLAGANRVALEGRLGKKLSAYLIAAAGGSDTDPVKPGLEPTQFSRIVTLRKDTRNSGEALNQLSDGIDHIHKKLLESRMTFKTVSAVAILTDLSTITKSKTLVSPSADEKLIRRHASELLGELSDSSEKDFRRVGVRISGLTHSDRQKSLSEFTIAKG